ncbi:DUF308 domain-containing protein [Streptococcus hyovaginalis]
MKSFSLLAGLLSLLIGFYLFNQPLSAVATIGWLLALLIFIWGIQGLFAYFKRQRKTIWQLLQAIVSTVFGLVLLGSSALSLSRLVISFVAYWILTIAILRMMSGYQTRKMGFGNSTLNSGIAMFLLGLVLLLGPVLTSVFIGKFLSLVFIILGFSVLVFSFRR